MTATDDRVDLSHAGLRPVRDSVVGEGVFARRWERLMAARPRWADDDEAAPALAAVLGDLGEPDQRDATVAATFIQWLGTNVGLAFLGRAEQVGKLAMATRIGIGPHMLAWAETNKRVSTVNGGLRQIDCILTPPDAPRGRYNLPERAPDLTLRDHEVIERVASWLDGEEGLRFLDGAHMEMDRRHDEALQMRRGPR